MSRSESRASGISSASRARTTASSYSSRPPLESLVYSLVPTLAPSRSNARGSAPSSRPESRLDSDAEKERRAKVRELMDYCEDILASRLPSTTPLSAATLPDSARRLLASSRQERSSSSTSTESPADKALRFSGLWNRIEKGKTLEDPIPHLQFLLALSKLNPSNALRPPSTNTGTKSPKPDIFPSTQPSTSRTPLQDIDSGNKAPPEWSGKGKSKAEILAAWRTSQSQPPFPSQLLLRDTLYLLQGIDGRYVRFATQPPPQQNPYLSEKGKSAEGAGFPLGKDGAPEVPNTQEGEVVGIDIVADEKKDGTISTPTRTLLAGLSEMGVMYRKVTNFTKSTSSGTASGMIKQSLCHFLHHELSEYHRLLAILESQLAQSRSQPSTSDQAASPEGAGLTLMRLGLWTEEMRLKMRMMSDVVDDAKTSHGGALVSKIHGQTSHGDPFVRKFMEQILEEVSKPFFSTLSRWIFSGDLHDPFKEFFVQLNPEQSRDHTSPYQSTAGNDAGFEGGLSAAGGIDEAGKIWEKKYVFVKSMVPGFVNEDFAKKIFSIGRSLNFIRYSCGDSDWIETQAQLANEGKVLKYSDLPGLERSIDDAYAFASQRILEIFFDKFNLLDHLRALKSYLMLGAGDFTEHLMEALAPRLSKPAISLYRHHLTSDLESAIRGSNAQYDSPDILRRLDARILDYNHGEIGWDCFALEYKVEAPLNAVLDMKAMGDYDKLFHHLWRLKRVESALTQGWMRVTSGSRVLEKLPSLSNDWHHCRIVQAEMVHFLRQLQAYCQLEVIECSWQSLLDFTKKREGDLDALIQAHRTYLSRVVRKILLLGNKREKEEILLDLVQEALDQILLFKDATDDLYAWSLAEATRIDRERDEERGLYTAPVSSAKSSEQLHNIRERIRSCSNNFQDRIVSLCHLAGSHSDLDVRFLAIRIAFNGHYSLRRPASKSASSRSNRA